MTRDYPPFGQRVIFFFSESRVLPPALQQRESKELVHLTHLPSPAPPKVQIVIEFEKSLTTYTSVVVKYNTKHLSKRNTSGPNAKALPEKCV